MGGVSSLEDVVLPELVDDSVFISAVAPVPGFLEDEQLQTLRVAAMK